MKLDPRDDIWVEQGFPVLPFIVAFSSISLYNVAELTGMVFLTFKKWGGFYFWCLLVATWGIAFNSIGFLLKHLALSDNLWLEMTLILVGWCMMVTGQSLVLYSRLHLVLGGTKRLKFAKYMILGNIFVLHIPVIIIVYGTLTAYPDPWNRVYLVYEKVQLTTFFVQEFILSALYIWETVKLLQTSRVVRDKAEVRHLLSRLVYINVVIILLDVTVLAFQFTNRFVLQTGYKPLAYSIKLKLEFSVLNQLVDIVTHGSRSGTASWTRSGTNHSQDHDPMTFVTMTDVDPKENREHNETVHLTDYPSSVPSSAPISTFANTPRPSSVGNTSSSHYC